MIKTLLIVIVAQIWITAGQICFKKSADKLEASAKTNTPWLVQLLESIMTMPMLWAGGACMFVGMCCWFVALASGDLNFVYMLGSIQFIIMLIAAHFILQEKINANKLFGTLLITLGIILTMIS